VVFGMPRAAIQTGAVKRIVPLHQIAEAITEGVKEVCNKYQAA
jgi:chemotaxis response regulator CheB